MAKYKVAKLRKNIKCPDCEIIFSESNDGMSEQNDFIERYDEELDIDYMECSCGCEFIIKEKKVYKMKRTNLELLEYDEFWKNNHVNDIRYIVKKFIDQYKTSEFCCKHFDTECDKLRLKNSELELEIAKLNMEIKYGN